MSGKMWSTIALVLAIIAAVINFAGLGANVGASFYLAIVALILHIVGTLQGE